MPKNAQKRRIADMSGGVELAGTARVTRCWKKGFASQEEAQEFCDDVYKGNEPGMRPYWCVGCESYHLGHNIWVRRKKRKK